MKKPDTQLVPNHPPPPQPNHPPTHQPTHHCRTSWSSCKTKSDAAGRWLIEGEGGGGSTGVWVKPAHHELLNTCALYNDFLKPENWFYFLCLSLHLLYKIDVTVIVRIRIGLRVLAKSDQSKSWFTIRRTKNCFNCLRKAGTLRNFLMLLSL